MCVHMLTVYPGRQWPPRQVLTSFFIPSLQGTDKGRSPSAHILYALIKKWSITPYFVLSHADILAIFFSKNTGLIKTLMRKIFRNSRRHVEKKFSSKIRLRTYSHIGFFSFKVTPTIVGVNAFVHVSGDLRRSLTISDLRKIHCSLCSISISSAITIDCQVFFGFCLNFRS